MLICQKAGGKKPHRKASQKAMTKRVRQILEEADDDRVSRIPLQPEILPVQVSSLSSVTSRLPPPLVSVTPSTCSTLFPMQISTPVQLPPLIPCSSGSVMQQLNLPYSPTVVSPL